MRILITGIWRRGLTPTTVEFVDGVLSGEAGVIAHFEAIADALQGTPVVSAAVSSVIPEDHKTDPLSFVAIMADEVFEEYLSVETSGPVAVKLPDGAVG